MYYHRINGVYKARYMILFAVPLLTVVNAKHQCPKIFITQYRKYYIGVYLIVIKAHYTISMPPPFFIEGWGE